METEKEALGPGGAAEPGMDLADGNAEIELRLGRATCLARKMGGAWILTGWMWRYMTCGFAEFC